MFSKQSFLKFGLASLVLASIFLADQGLAAKINLKPIKPAANQTQPLSDEQQSILAVRSIKPSVVSIYGNSSQYMNNNPLPYSVETISGTGFVWSQDGLIVSNNHVVSDPKAQYYVSFADGTTYTATIVGQDQFDDVALLKIDATNLPVAKLGNSDALETGQTVFAIGNTLGKYQNTVTKGVVSGLGRALDEGSDSNPQPRLQNMIQTDAAINPGNSGGPLIDMAGEVIGMDTLIDTSGSGLGFAIPISTIKNAVQQLQQFGKVSRPYIGVTFTTITPAAQALRGITTAQGAIVEQVAPGGPAARAGIQVGDIITAINGQKLDRQNELDIVINKYMAGTQITLTYSRNGQSTDVPIILGQIPGQ